MATARPGLLLLVASTAFACAIKEPTYPQGLYPREFPIVPPPDAAAAEVPDGYRVEVVVRDLVYPTSVTFDDAGNIRRLGDADAPGARQPTRCTETHRPAFLPAVPHVTDPDEAGPRMLEAQGHHRIPGRRGSLSGRRAAAPGAPATPGSRRRVLTACTA